MRTILAIGLLTLPAAAYAVNTEPAGGYAGIALSQIDFSGKAISVLEEKPGWTALEFFGGYKHSPFVGLETRLGMAGSPELLYGSVYYRTESANETAKTYLLVGYSGGTIAGKGQKDVSLAGLSYGAGVAFPVGKNGNFNLEYRMLLDDSDKDVSLNALTASFDYRFSGSMANSDDRGFYGGLGVAQIDLSIDEPQWEQDELDSEAEENEGDSGPELEWNAIELIGGYSLTPFLTAELRLGTTDNAAEGGADFTLDYVSMYYRPSFSVGFARAYGLVGYSSVRANFQDEPDIDTGERAPKERETFSGISVGAGVSVPVIEKLNVGLEYRLLASDELYAEDEEDASGAKETWKFMSISANVNYRF